MARNKRRSIDVGLRKFSGFPRVVGDTDLALAIALWKWFAALATYGLSNTQCGHHCHWSQQPQQRGTL